VAAAQSVVSPVRESTGVRTRLYLCSYLRVWGLGLKPEDSDVWQCRECAESTAPHEITLWANPDWYAYVYAYVTLQY